MAGRVLDHVFGTKKLLDGLGLEEQHKDFSLHVLRIDEWLYANGSRAIDDGLKPFNDRDSTNLRYARAIRSRIDLGTLKVPEQIAEAYEVAFREREDMRRFHKGWSTRCDWLRQKENSHAWDTGAKGHEEYLERVLKAFQIVLFGEVEANERDIEAAARRTSPV